MGISCHSNPFLVGFPYFSCFPPSSTLLTRSLLREGVPEALLSRIRARPVASFPILQSRFALALDQARSLELLQSLLRPQELPYSIRVWQKSPRTFGLAAWWDSLEPFGWRKKKKKKADGEKKPPTRPAPTRPPPRSAPRGARGRAAVAVPARRCRPTPPAAAPREAAAELGLPPALRATRSSRDGAPHCLPALRAKSFSRPESPVFFFVVV